LIELAFAFGERVRLRQKSSPSAKEKRSATEYSAALEKAKKEKEVFVYFLSNIRKSLKKVSEINFREKR